MKASLNNLRDMVIFGFVMANALFILIVFLLQLNKSEIHIRWPYAAKNTIIFDETVNEIIIKREYLELEPIGLAFIGLFGVILLIQFTAMLIHRFSTISQILAFTNLDWSFGRKETDISVGAELNRKAVSIALQFQRPKRIWDDDDQDEQEKTVYRRDTIKRLLLNQQDKQDQSNLEANFKKQYEAMSKKDTHS
jgi:chitin synthase